MKTLFSIILTTLLGIVPAFAGYDDPLFLDSNGHHPVGVVIMQMSPDGTHVAPVGAAGGAITPAQPGTFAVATGGTPVTVFAANGTTTNSRICNFPDATINIFVNSVSAATLTEGGANEPLVPGQCWNAGGVLTTPVSVNAASAITFGAVK